MQPLIFLRVGLFFCAVSSVAFAAGGSCNSIPVPSGVTSCFYISAAGLDTNNGTSEATPWLHAPGMPNCSNTCQSTTPAAGEGFIFRGGDTWHFGNSSATPYTGGTWTLVWNGTSSKPIYWGVDQTWYTAGSWVRPALNADNPITTSTTLSSCAHNVGNQNIFIQAGGISYQTIDNFEMVGLCESDTNDSQQDTYIRYGSSQGNVYSNLYMHGWSHVQFSAPGSGACGSDIGVCPNMFAFQGGSSNGAPSETLINVIIDGADSDPFGLGACYCDFWNVSYSVIRYQQQMIVRRPHIFHDNLVEYAYAGYHSNVLESVSDDAGTNVIYNNVFRHLSFNTPTSQVGFWPYPSTGTTDYFFNNVIYDPNNIQLFNVGQNGSNQGPLRIFNNTWQMSGTMFGCPTGGEAFPFTAANNHYITDATSPYGASCSSQLTTVTNAQMTTATATSSGYTPTQTFAYSPTSSGSPTVGGGTSETTAFCGALSTAGLTAAASACQSDTTYACAYNTTSHAVTCPARTVVARQSGWDAGAYQYSAATQNQGPTAPPGFSATAK